MNAPCASGISLGACLLECLLTHPSPLWAGQSNDSPVVRWNLSVASLYMLKWSVPRRVDLRIWNELLKTSGPVVSSSDRFALFTAGVVSSHEHHRQRVGRRLIRETENTLWSSVARFPARTSKGWEIKTASLPSLMGPKSLHRLNASFLWTSNQARGPAEFKHITRPRKRN